MTTHQKEPARAGSGAEDPSRPSSDDAPASNDGATVAISGSAVPTNGSAPPTERSAAQATDDAPPSDDPSVPAAHAETDASTPTTSANGNGVLALAADVELIGEYEGSGYREPPLIARRADGQVVQLTEMLYRIAERCDGAHDEQQIADEVGRELGKELSADNVRFLVDEKIRPLGILKNADGSDPAVERVNPFLALKFRTALVPDRIVHALTTVFRPLFWPPVLIAAVAAFAAFDVWLFFVHGIGSGLHQVMYQPVLLLLVLGLLVVATAFHEIGHATACRYGGAAPGTIGFGIYLVWPAFYTDVTDAYRLGRWGRIRVDLGGVYFNAVFILVEAALYWYTGYEPLLIAILVQHLEMLHQFLPFLRLDGYFVVSDLVGVPDLFTRMKPLLLSLVPGRQADPSVQQLKPKVRVAVTAWVLLVVPILAFQLGMIVLHAPRIFGTGLDSLGKQSSRAVAAWGDASYVDVAAAGVQILALALPLLGIAYMLVRLAKQLSVGAWRQSEGRPALRTAYATAGVAMLGFIGWTWLPNGDYAPIERNERWTVQTGLASARHAATGRAGLVPADERAATEPFGAEPDTEQTRQPVTPDDALDPDTRVTPEPDELSDIDPETSADPIFDGSPAPRQQRRTAEAPEAEATSAPAQATSAPGEATSAPATAEPSP